MAADSTTAAVALVAAASAGDSAWILASCALVLLMTPGLAFFYGGLVPGRYVLNTMMMSIISMGITALPWMTVGFSLAFGGEGSGPLIGDLTYAGLGGGLEDIVWPGTRIPGLLFAVYQLTFLMIAAAIISGAVVGRMRFSAYMIFIFLWSLLVYVPLCQWVWGPQGWIEEMGAKDFAGGTVVHMSTAVTAGVLAVFLGPRLSHVGEDGEDKEKDEPHNVPFVILGGSLLWFGWTGFNGGCALAADATAALAVINTYLSAGASLMMWTVLARWQFGSYSAVGTVTGALVGLVIITPAAGHVSPVSAALMGAIGCALVYPTFHFHYNRFDDSLDCVPCHGVGGLVGTMLTGFFAREGGLLFGGGFRLLAAQLAATVVTLVYAISVSAVLFFLLSRCMQMRVTEEDESKGLDCTVHGEAAYGKRHSEAIGKRPSDAFRSGSSGRRFVEDVQGKRTSEGPRAGRRHSDAFSEWLEESYGMRPTMTSRSSNAIAEEEEDSGTGQANAASVAVGVLQV